MLRMWSHSVSTLMPGIALGTACISNISLSDYTKELLTLYCAVKFKCTYTWARHVNGAKAQGVTDSQLQALKDGIIQDRDVWDEQSVAFLAFLDETIDCPEASNETFNKAKKWFSDREMVEIVTAQGFYYMWSRIATTFQVEVDEGLRGDYEKAKNWAKTK
ncbi:hypothetical protein NQ176_g345 [Zarea fungicola]|uniref:Uncharacterized protein n=1 Tax=Zarea fungicola TaxID=93591 RepID=A0ACC1NYI9_9HYPO|nr:hypothetical protein NQ176_g345 [Lecanicillium fungicola]